MTAGGKGGRKVRTGLACGACGACGLAFARPVRGLKKEGARGRARSLYCSVECACKAGRGEAAQAARKAAGKRGAGRGKGSATATAISNRDLRRQLRAESAERRRRMAADPRLIIHCHWCMDEAHTRLLDPAWRRAGVRGRTILLCSRCAGHVRKFMRQRGYEMLRTSNRRAAAIMEEIAAMPSSAAQRRRAARNG